MPRDLVLQRFERGRHRWAKVGLRSIRSDSKLAQGDGRNTAANEAKTHYDTLHVAPGASRDEIRQSYRRLILLQHPDKRTSAAAGLDNAATPEALNAAYETLYDPEKRAVYDADLQEKQAQQTAQGTKQAVSHILSLADFSTKSSDLEEIYYFPSRCGGEFRVDADMLEDGNGELVVGCEGCTERIKVLYEMVDA